MNKETERPDKFTFRLLDQKDNFFNYIERNEINKSDALRHFIKQGVTAKNGRTLNDELLLREKIVSLKKELRLIGINLNQIARYFNENGILQDKNLEVNHSIILKKQEELDHLIHKILTTI